MLHENVRQNHRADSQRSVEPSLIQQELRDVRAETANRALLDGDQRIVFVGQTQDQLDVERLGEARVGDGSGDIEIRQFVGSLQTFGESRSEREKRNVVSGAHDPAFADREALRDRRNDRANPLAARITKRRRTIVDGGRRRHHLRQFRLVRRAP